MHVQPIPVQHDGHIKEKGIWEGARQKRSLMDSTPEGFSTHKIETIDTSNWSESGNIVIIFIDQTIKINNSFCHFFVLAPRLKILYWAIRAEFLLAKKTQRTLVRVIITKSELFTSYNVQWALQKYVFYRYVKLLFLK